MNDNLNVNNDEAITTKISILLVKFTEEAKGNLTEALLWQLVQEKAINDPNFNKLINKKKLAYY